MDAATTSVGVTSPAKDLILKQEAALLLELEGQAKEIMKLIMDLSGEKIQRDAKILTSMGGIGDKTAFNFLIEMGGDITAFEHDRKLIAAAGLDPTTYESGKYKGQSKISKRGNRHLRRGHLAHDNEGDYLKPGVPHLLFQKKKRGAHLQEGRPGYRAQADQGDVLYVGKRKML
jgi:transposase